MQVKSRVKNYLAASAIGMISIWFSLSSPEVPLGPIPSVYWKVFSVAASVALTMYPLLPRKQLWRGGLIAAITSIFTSKALSLLIIDHVGLWDVRVASNVMIVILLLVSWPYILPGRSAEDLINTEDDRIGKH